MAAPGPSRQADDTRADWETPAALYDQLNREFHFNYDGAANEINHKCDLWFGPGGCFEDAFQADPIGDVVWCNPPYGKRENVCDPDKCKRETCRKRGSHCTEFKPGVEDWVELLSLWHSYGNTVVACLPDGTDTDWFKQAYDTCSEVRILSGRVPFVGTTSGNTGGTIIVIWRQGPKTPAPYMWLWDWRKGV